MDVRTTPQPFEINTTQKQNDELKDEEARKVKEEADNQRIRRQEDDQKQAQKPAVNSENVGKKVDVTA